MSGLRPMRRPGRLGIATAVVVAVTVAWAATAVAGSAPSKLVERKQVGSFTATLELTLVGDPEYRRIRSAHLRVVKAGAPVLDRVVRLPKQCAGEGCVIPDVRSYRTLELRRLDTPDPVALLWLWTGGAHCCSVLEAIELPGGRTSTIDFGNGGATVKVLDGATVFVGQDERFPYRYTSYAASGAPVAVFALAGGRFRNVTAAHLGIVQENALAWWDAYLHARSGMWEARGVFSAWAADACRLGRRAKVEARLADGVRRGWFSPPRADPFAPYGAAWAKVLMRDLEKLGYCAKG